MNLQSLFVLIISFLFFSCSDKSTNQSNENENNVKSSAEVSEKKKDKDIYKIPVLENIDIESEEFVYKPGLKNNFISKKNGTELNLPLEAFVDKNGDKISEDVKITYKEIRSAAEIIALNIDMKYDSAGVSYNFQTAGMFDINAFVNGEKVFLEDGKEISITYDLKTDENYNFYRYDEENWIYKNSYEELEIPKTKKRAPKNLGLKPSKLNIDEDLIMEIDINYNHIDEIKIYSDIIWKYAGAKTNNEVMKLMQRGIFKPALSKTSEKGKYTLSFKKGKKNHNLFVSPVFSGKAFKKAMNNFNASNVSSQNQTGNNSKRKTSVSTLGLHNYDRIYHRKDAINILADFKIKKEEDITKFNVFHITGNEDNVVVNLNPFEKNNIYLSKNLKNKFIAILPENKIAVLSSNDFIKIQNHISHNMKDVILELNSTGRKIESVEELDEIIASL